MGARHACDHQASSRQHAPTRHIDQFRTGVLTGTISATWLLLKKLLIGPIVITALPGRPVTDSTARSSGTRCWRSAVQSRWRPRRELRFVTNRFFEAFGDLAVERPNERGYTAGRRQNRCNTAECEFCAEGRLLGVADKALAGEISDGPGAFSRRADNTVGSTSPEVDRNGDRLQVDARRNCCARRSRDDPKIRQR